MNVDPTLLTSTPLDPFLLAIIVYMLGAIGRTSYAFIFKQLEAIRKGERLQFDQLYWFTMLISMLVTILASPLTFVNVVVPIGSEYYIIITSFCMGYAINDALNRPVSFLVKMIAKKG